MINLEIQKGMYVRYKYHNEQKIGKVDFIIYNEFADENFIGLTNNEGIFEGKILKASFNIIDLIEVGDYVNGYKVLFIDVFFSEGKNVKCINNEEERVCFYEEDIKDIITKEQFNSMKYVVERDTNENL